MTAPPTTVQPAKLERTWRVLGGFVSVGALGVLLIAVMLRPSGEGHGTHTQLGMPDCAWAVTLDTPCPTCGMTTSFAHAAGGDLLTSIVTQPLGFLLVIGTASTVWGGAHTAIGGVRLGPLLGAMTTKWSMWGLAAAALGAWVYKIITWG